MRWLSFPAEFRSAIRTRPGWRMAALFCGLMAATIAPAATFTVTNTADTGPGTLRQGIVFANTNPGPDAIAFQLTGTPPFAITPLSLLPTITETVTLDATTQTGYTNRPVIELIGTSAGAASIGLRFSAGASTVRGLCINRFAAAQVQLDSPSNVVQGLYLGTDVTGLIARGGGTGSHGVLVKNSGNLIGGLQATNGNLIAGGNDTGVYVLNAFSNTICGNLIGLNAAGSLALSNINNGVLLYNGGGNLVGGATSAAANIIAGNNQSGVYVNGPAAAGNVIQGNRIGTGPAGTNAIKNKADGVSINGAPGTLLISNLISGNGVTGVSIAGSGATGTWLRGNRIGLDITGQIALPNRTNGVGANASPFTIIGGTNAGDGNVISGNGFDGIVFTGGSVSNRVQANLIGLSAAGTNAVPNTQNGISLDGSTGNQIGGSAAAAQNWISGNAANGIFAASPADAANVIQGNDIGTDGTGTKAVANTLAGILMQGASNQISGNLISGNSQQGIWLVGNNGDATANVIVGNWIGVSATGKAKLANGNAGIGISTAAGNQIGGTTATERNLISGNGDAGIFILDAASKINTIQGNYIGTDDTGTAGLGNTFEGVYLELCSSNIIGGAASGAGNVIAANNTQGIYLTNTFATLIQGNSIGTKADGTNPLQNKFHNIELEKNASRNRIVGNRIAFAPTIYTGVRIRSNTTNNLISGNAIFGNAALGIDLNPTDGTGGAGVNAIVGCGSGVSASAANRGQNFPTLTNAWSGSGTRIRGSLNAPSGKPYTLEFFASPTLDVSGYGEGQVYLGQTNLTLGTSCSSNFTVTLPAIVPAGWVITATATDNNNNTSEFSAGITNTALPLINLVKAGPTQVSVTWTNIGNATGLWQTFSLTPPVAWFNVTNAPGLSNGWYSVILRSTNPAAFYRLSAP